MPALLLQAQEPGFTETFDDPTLPGWEHSPNVTVVDGVLRVEPGGFAFRHGEWGDLSLNVRARRAGEGHAVLLVTYRASNAGDYTVLLGPDFVALQRRADGVEMELGAALVEFIPAGEWFQVSVIVAGEAHEVMLNNELALAVADPDPLPTGGVSLSAHGDAAGEFDDLMVIVAGESPSLVEASPMPEPSSLAETPPPVEPTAEIVAPAPSQGIPAYRAESWIFVGGPPGGIGYDIRYSFSDPNIWYVTDTCGGLHISTNRGLTWQQSNAGIAVDPFGCYTVFSATVDPHNPDIIWVGTRDPGHIYRSADGGRTWEDRTANATSGPAVAYRGFTVDPRSSDTVYAMAEVTDWVFRDEGELTEYDLSFGDYAGGRIFKTEDAGLTWTRIWQGPALARYLWINPNQPDELYASTGIFDRQPLNYPTEDVHGANCGGVGILKSTDGGQTWDVIGFEQGLTSLTIGSLYMHPEDPHTLLAGGGSGVCIVGPGSGGEFVPRYGGVYLTTDGGLTWKAVLEEDVITSVEFCEANPQIAYAASIIRVYRSDDGGQTWQVFGDPERQTWGPPGLNPGTPIDIQTDPDDCYRVFINNYTGGNFISTNGGENWSDASHGYTGSTIWDLYVDPENSMKVVVGSGIAPWVSEDGGLTWRGVANGELQRGAMALAGDPGDPNHFVAQLGTQNTPLLGVFETTDGGEYWAKVFELPTQEPFLRFVNFAFAPSDPEVIYGATLHMSEFPDMAVEFVPYGMGVYRSRDGGTTWLAPTDPSIAGNGFMALAVSPTDPNIVYAGAFYSQGLFKSVDGGQTWAPTNEGLPEPYGNFSAIAIDPRDNGVVYAGGSVGLFKSSNAGGSWVRLAAGLDPAANFSDILMDPTNPDMVYVGTYNFGVYCSHDSGESFQQLDQGLNLGEGAHLRVLSLALSHDGTVLYAGTQGMGVLRLGPSTEEPTPAGPGISTGAPLLAQPTVPPIAAAPTNTSSPAQPTALTETAPTPAPASGRGICGSVAAMPLVLVGLVWINRRRR